MHEQLVDLISKGFLPEEPTLVELEKTIEYDKFSSLTLEQKLEIKENAIVVCNGALWAIPDELSENGEILPSTTFYSGDGKNVYRHLRRAKFCICEVTEYGIVNTPLEALYINKSNENLRGDLQMSDNQFPSFDNLSENVVSDLTKAGAPTTASSEAFAGEGQASSSGGSTNPTVAELRKISASIDLSEGVTNYLSFMQEESTLLGYVTRNDAYISSYYKPIVKNRDELRPTAPDDIKEQFLNGDKHKIKFSYFHHHYDVNFKQVRPGAVLGIAIEAPLNLNIDIIALQDPNFQFERPTNVVKRKYMFKRQEAFGILVYNYPGGIKEDPRTHPGVQDMIEVEATYVKMKDSDQSKENRRLVGRSRRFNYIRETNYLPVNTFETVNLSKAQISEDEQKGLNAAAFFNLAKTIGDANGKFALLNPEHAKLLEGTTDKLNIHSKYFAATLDARETFEVDSFHTKGKKLEVIEFPTKKVNENKKDSGEVTYSASYNKISAVNKDVHNSQNPLSSLHSPKFQVVRDVFGPDLANVEILRDLARASGGGTQTKANVNRGVDLFKISLAGYTSDVKVEEIHTDAKALRAAVQRNLFS